MNNYNLIGSSAKNDTCHLCSIKTTIFIFQTYNCDHYQNIL